MYARRTNMAAEPPCKKFKKDLNERLKAPQSSKKQVPGSEKDFLFDSTHSFSFFKSLLLRSYGIRTNLLNDPLSSSCKNKIGLKFYSSLRYARKYHDVSSTNGAIYNIEFSSCDKYALAATAQSDIIILDPCCSKVKVNQFSSKQVNGVNGITFIDERTFASCSDDTSIMLWDIRNVSEAFGVLKGHTSWVKDLSYNPSTKHLFSSAFDEKIISWDLDNIGPDGSYCNKVILTVPFITRTKFAQDFSKMFVSTTAGCLLVFDDFNENTIGEKCQEYVDTLSSGLLAVSLNDLQEKLDDSINMKVIAEFPEIGTESNHKGQPLCFGSIQVSPTLKYLLSRYTTRGRKEWSTLHELSADRKKSGRLAGYIDEPNVMQEFIKEPSFSADGRVICSPFGHAVRILAIDQDETDNDNILSETAFLTTHRSPVLCCKFANTKMLLASGCMSGQIVFYEPKIF